MQFYLGLMYEEGQCVPQNFKEALVWFRKAAVQRDAGAQCNLGLMYNQGLGLRQNFKEALAWFRKAADQGHAGAQCSLGVMYDLSLLQGWNQEGAPTAGPYNALMVLFLSPVPGARLPSNAERSVKRSTGKRRVGIRDPVALRQKHWLLYHTGEY